MNKRNWIKATISIVAGGLMLASSGCVTTSINDGTSNLYLEQNRVMKRQFEEDIWRHRLKTPFEIEQERRLRGVWGDSFDYLSRDPWRDRRGQDYFGPRDRY